MESVTLYYREGSSDKVYTARLEPSGDQWVVSFAFGRRGSILTTGTKTQQPVSYDDAQRIYQKLIRDKKAKGYSPGEDGTPYQGTSSEDTGVRPQLLNAIEVDELPKYLADDGFVLQPKLDGRRLLIRKQGEEITGINRKGLACGIPNSIVTSALELEGDFLIDGEAIGDILHVFDILELNGVSLREMPYRRRIVDLLGLLATGIAPSILWVACYWGIREKSEALNSLRETKAEGVVLKRASAPYTVGRPASGGDQLKFKFVASASVIISGINAKRSAAISLMKGDQLVPAGNVTVPPNHPVPEVGQVAEVRYLYAMPDSGALFQPVYLGRREDIEPTECLVDQLKYKQAA